MCGCTGPRAVGWRARAGHELVLRRALAAFFAEIGARVPGVGFATGVIVPTIAVMAIAAGLIHSGVPRIIE